MNIVSINSGLGNQMFQYAFFKALSKKGEVKMDISEFRYRKFHNGYELEKIFDIEKRYASQKEICSAADVWQSPIADFRRKILKWRRKTKSRLFDEREIGYRYNAGILEYENTYFKGFWQSEKYFSDIEQEIRRDFSFQEPLSGINAETACQIAQTLSVSVHIRRGDYLKKRRYSDIGSVCSTAYYRNAAEYIKSHYENAHFFVFSDDIETVKKELSLDRVTYIDFNRGADSYKDMRLMSLCRHHIIANSSFSWWGAWLNPSSDKIVVAPDIWVRGEEKPDIVPETWIKLATE